MLVSKSTKPFIVTFLFVMENSEINIIKKSKEI